MGKIKQFDEIPISKLKPYHNNAKKHNDYQIQKLCNSIDRFGFLSPCVIDDNYNLIAGHGRVIAAKELGLEKVPCVFVSGLTEAERKAYILADNKLSELAEWDNDLLNIELEYLDIDMSAFGFSLNNEWFEKRETNDNSNMENESDEYKEFVEKFEPKRTTDDCYTPPAIMEAVETYVSQRYGLNKNTFIRPFYPGGDYEHEKYPPNCVVVDNPPFSILTEIIEFYNRENIKYFLFCPSTSTLKNNATAVCVGVSVTYENNAVVSTNFLTNLDNEYRVMSCPELHKMISLVNKEHCEVKLHPKYDYPIELVTAAKMNYLSQHDVEFKIRKEDCSAKISELDSQKELGKGIFGGGFLISEKAAAEKAAAEKAAAEKAAAEKAAAEKAAAIKFELSEREIDIVKSLGAKDGE